MKRSVATSPMMSFNRTGSGNRAMSSGSQSANSGEISAGASSIATCCSPRWCGN
jgi:hypothetical protein